VSDFLHRRWVVQVVFVLAAATLGGLARGLVQAYCHSAPDGPVDGTAGFAYCSRVSHPYSWAVFAVTAVACALIVAWLGRRWKHSRMLGLAVVSVLLVANTIVVFSLPDLGP
jgi:hypothetical protein